ncbi:MAG: hypothetical protein LBF72_02285 [Holosporales bacterium]|jgi:hypothetical protein|nr:hypothetical protein [Holosporales bacterium]
MTIRAQRKRESSQVTKDLCVQRFAARSEQYTQSSKELRAGDTSRRRRAVLNVLFLPKLRAPGKGSQTLLWRRSTTPQTFECWVCPISPLFLWLGVVISHGLCEAAPQYSSPLEELLHAGDKQDDSSVTGQTLSAFHQEQPGDEAPQREYHQRFREVFDGDSLVNERMSLKNLGLIKKISQTHQKVEPAPKAQETESVVIQEQQETLPNVQITEENPPITFKSTLEHLHYLNERLGIVKKKPQTVEPTLASVTDELCNTTLTTGNKDAQAALLLLADKLPADILLTKAAGIEQIVSAAAMATVGGASGVIYDGEERRAMELSKEHVVCMIFKEFMESIPRSVIKISLTNERIKSFVDAKFKLFVADVNNRLKKYDIEISDEGGFDNFVKKWHSILETAYDVPYVVMSDTENIAGATLAETGQQEQFPLAKVNDVVRDNDEFTPTTEASALFVGDFPSQQEVGGPVDSLPDLGVALLDTGLCLYDEDTPTDSFRDLLDDAIDVSSTSLSQNLMMHDVQPPQGLDAVSGGGDVEIVEDISAVAPAVILETSLTAVPNADEIVSVSPFEYKEAAFVEVQNRGSSSDFPNNISADNNPIKMDISPIIERIEEHVAQVQSCAELTAQADQILTPGKVAGFVEASLDKPANLLDIRLQDLSANLEFSVVLPEREPLKISNNIMLPTITDLNFHSVLTKSTDSVAYSANQRQSVLSTDDLVIQRGKNVSKVAFSKNYPVSPDDAALDVRNAVFVPPYLAEIIRKKLFDRESEAKKRGNVLCGVGNQEQTGDDWEPVPNRSIAGKTALALTAYDKVATKINSSAIDCSLKSTPSLQWKHGFCELFGDGANFPFANCAFKMQPNVLQTAPVHQVSERILGWNPVVRGQSCARCITQAEQPLKPGKIADFVVVRLDEPTNFRGIGIVGSDVFRAVTLADNLLATQTLEHTICEAIKEDSVIKRNTNPETFSSTPVSFVQLRYSDQNPVCAKSQKVCWTDDFGQQQSPQLYLDPTAAQLELAVRATPRLYTQSQKELLAGDTSRSRRAVLDVLLKPSNFGIPAKSQALFERCSTTPQTFWNHISSNEKFTVSSITCLTMEEHTRACAANLLQPALFIAKLLDNPSASNVLTAEIAGCSAVDMEADANTFIYTTECAEQPEVCELAYSPLGAGGAFVCLCSESAGTGSFCDLVIHPQKEFEGVDTLCMRGAAYAYCSTPVTYGDQQNCKLYLDVNSEKLHTFCVSGDLDIKGIDGEKIVADRQSVLAKTEQQTLYIRGPAETLGFDSRSSLLDSGFSGLSFSWDEYTSNVQTLLCSRIVEPTNSSWPEMFSTGVAIIPAKPTLIEETKQSQNSSAQLHSTALRPAENLDEEAYAVSCFNKPLTNMCDNAPTFCADLVEGLLCEYAGQLPEIENTITYWAPTCAATFTSTVGKIVPIVANNAPEEIDVFASF